MAGIGRRELLAIFLECDEAAGDVKPAAAILWNLQEGKGQAEISYISGDPYTVLVLSDSGESKEQFEFRISLLLKAVFDEAEKAEHLAESGYRQEEPATEEDWKESPGGSA